jgi:ankyrin repeat protein
MKQDIFDMKYQAVNALLDVNAAAAAARDTFQRTPLHWACMDVAGNHPSKDSSDGEDSILLLLMERAPQAVHMLDNEKRTPLHYLVARNANIPLNLLAKVVALSPESLSMKDEVGETPLDIIQSRKDELDNVDDLLSTLSKLQSMLTSSGREVLATV